MACPEIAELFLVFSLNKRKIEQFLIHLESLIHIENLVEIEDQKIEFINKDTTSNKLALKFPWVKIYFFQVNSH